MRGDKTGQPIEGLFGPLNQSAAIFLVSAAGLFLEMLLIRWIGTEVRIFAYLQNTVLVVCILGLGMGCFTCRKPIQIRHSLLALLVLVSLLAIPPARRVIGRISELLSVLGDLMIWQNAVSTDPFATLASVTLGLLMTLGLMALLWEVFMPLGRMLGRAMDDHPQVIRAYSVNICGSLIGIWLFVSMSALELPPWAWFSAFALFMVFLVGARSERLLNTGVIAAIVGCAWLAAHNPNALEVTWSPYQKLVLSDNSEEREWPGKYLVAVNNAGYQGMIDLSSESVAKDTRIDASMQGLSQYDLPMLFHPAAKRVLIVGAGSGNDAAGALRNGAESVTAVEIDPAIIEMGKRYHPEHPYSSDRVTIVNDDARSYFASTHDRFDLIVFGLLDSHTTTAMTNARLDHYVYTRESLAQARTLLSDNGVIVLSFDAKQAFVAQRMGRCLADVFDTDPMVFSVPGSASGWGGVFFVSGHSPTIQHSLTSQPRLEAQIAQWRAKTPAEFFGREVDVATDDWPYIYLEGHRIPTLYYLLAALMAALLGYCRKRLNTGMFGARWSHSNWHFFFLGAAFMLLEVQGISKAAVVLGNTWLVNAVIISGILLMALGSNLAAARFPRIPQPLVAVALVTSCLLLYGVDLSRFAFLPYALKATLVGLLSATPVFFSGLIFIESFRTASSKDDALGANLIGALVGGLLQSLTFVIGINALLLVVGALYTAAMLIHRSAPRFAAQSPFSTRGFTSEIATA